MTARNPTDPHKFNIRFLRSANPFGDIDGANVRCFYSVRSENGDLTTKFLNLTYLIINNVSTPNTIFSNGLYRKDNTNPDGGLPTLIVPNFTPSESEDYTRRLIRREIFRDPLFRSRVLTEVNAPFILERDFNLLFNTLPSTEYKAIYDLMNIPNVRK